jgi:hypothetical protein
MKKKTICWSCALLIVVAAMTIILVSLCSERTIEARVLSAEIVNSFNYEAAGLAFIFVPEGRIVRAVSYGSSYPFRECKMRVMVDGKIVMFDDFPAEFCENAENGKVLTIKLHSWINNEQGEKYSLLAKQF